MKIDIRALLGHARAWGEVIVISLAVYGGVYVGLWLLGFIR